MNQLSKTSLAQIKEELKRASLKSQQKIIAQLKKDQRVAATKIVKQHNSAQRKKRKLKEQFNKLVAFDQKLRQKGFEKIAGVDEAGRGALAGPLVAASVMLPSNFYLEDLKECKQLLPEKREELYQIITEAALCFRVIEIPPSDIDKKGLHKINLEALRLAVKNLPKKADFVLADGYKLQNLDIPCLRVIKGDIVSLAVAAASIIAKVHRDRLMIKLSQQYPLYHFADNKGYGTYSHLKALKAHGPSGIHRCSFQPVKRAVDNLE